MSEPLASIVVLFRDLHLEHNGVMIGVPFDNGEPSFVLASHSYGFFWGLSIRETTCFCRKSPCLKDDW